MRHRDPAAASASATVAGRTVLAATAGAHGMAELRMRFPIAARRLDESVVLGAVVDARAATLRDRLRALGASVSATSDVDWLHVAVTVVVDELDATLDAVVDVLDGDPDPGLVQAAAEHTAAMLVHARRDLGVAADEATNVAIYGAQHPYAHRPEPAAVATLEPEALREALRAALEAPGAIAVLVGDAPAQLLVDALAVRLARMPTTASAPSSRAARQPFPVRAEVVEVPHAHGAQLRLAWPAPTPGHRDLPVVELLVAALGGGSGSRLFREVRERRGLAYGVRARVVHAAAASAVLVSTSARVGQADAALVAVEETVAGLAAARWKDDELRRLAGRLVAARAMTVATPAGRAEHLAAAAARGEAAFAADDARVRAFADVTPARMARVAQETFVAGPRVCVVARGA